MSSSEFHGHESEVDTGEVMTKLEDGLSPKRVIEFLRSYRVQEPEIIYLDGHRRRFQKYVQNDPSAFTKLALQIIDLHPSFVRAFFDGISDAIKAKQNIDWEPVLSLCKKIIKSENQKMKGKSISKAMAYFIDEGLRTYSADFTFKDTIWELLTHLASLEDTDPSMEKDYPDTEWTSFTISRNTINGVTFNSILSYAIWCNKHTNDKKLVPEVKKLISDYLDRKMPASVSRQAVLGFYLPVLYWFDKEWIRARLDKLFNSTNELLSKSAWDAYLENNVIKVIFMDLIDIYDLHIQKLTSSLLKDGNIQKSDRLVIRHITLAYLFKFDGAKNLFDKMILHPHDEVLSYCTSEISQILRHQKDESEEFFDTDAFRELWRNSKLTTNDEIRNWFKYSPLDEKETLDLLYNSLENADEPTDIPFPVEELESYARAHPVSTIKYLSLLIEKGRKSLEYCNLYRLKILLGILLNNSKTKKETTVLIHKLEDLGLSDYGDLLKLQ